MICHECLVDEATEGVDPLGRRCKAGQGWCKTCLERAIRSQSWTSRGPNPYKRYEDTVNRERDVAKGDLAEARSRRTG